ncbi:hypothetical protein C2845_PM11G16870 [Panicum miliaceum]|uniref:Uncharacterized protein n=1 Tax=Panicum miliaceum TaxID=4540 RepID=A0A3L6RR62_PANMI|nr:hypothetical protein C2845_PM11G16870 [Panicum miliaceum]
MDWGSKKGVRRSQIHQVHGNTVERRLCELVADAAVVAAGLTDGEPRYCLLVPRRILRKSLPFACLLAPP